MTVRYVAQPGDETYTIPDAGAFGFAFSRGTDPSGATLPVAVVQRTFYDGESRIFQLRPASAFGVVNAVYVCLTPMTVNYGEKVAGFLTFVQLAWNAQTGDESSPPTTLQGGARVWGWTAA